MLRRKHQAAAVIRSLLPQSPLPARRVPLGRDVRRLRQPLVRIGERSFGARMCAADHSTPINRSSKCSQRRVLNLPQPDAK
jgi:hypothetical protein